ncbi:hypothetical protein [Zhenpiania hominis]|uniref:Uncharacterized protein n=1 Tax=Zhenpiania hominis TaxID=2763644 RepID=A0A923SS39_9FIRM|nr:hypothetical protein [Zhenpiania hominis]MBC6681341.1 hypothetical protein [Zhenpiania hominis]
MWISKSEWYALLEALANAETVLGAFSRMVKNKKLTVMKYDCAYGEPLRVEVLLSLSAHEWSQIENSKEWGKIVKTYLEGEHQAK